MLNFYGVSTRHYQVIEVSLSSYPVIISRSSLQCFFDPLKSYLDITVIMGKGNKGSLKR